MYGIQYNILVGLMVKILDGEMTADFPFKVSYLYYSIYVANWVFDFKNLNIYK